ncbi:protein GOLM2 isoform X2 [Antennarius striatus]|uniref:protein GOLM2 isoform X2 n=1 Tax=Antennarius striatus TaxID=241820 RepID=UPI0035B42705
MVGFGANRRGGRLPSFILIFLMVIIAILAFNYWTVSNKHGRLLDELAEVQTQVKRTDAARSRLEKRNSELMVQVDTHRKQIDQKDGDYSVLAGKLQAQETLIRKCTDDKMKLQNDVTTQMTEIQRMTEQLKELKLEFIKKEDQLKEVKKNSTTFEKRLEYESFQCGRQITQLKEEYEETKKMLEKEVLKLRLSVMDGQKGGEAGAPDALVGQRHIVPTLRHVGPDLKEEMGKPGSDAGMPGIEDSEVGKVDDMQFALRKPSVVQKQMEIPFPGAGHGVGAADGPGGQFLSLDRPGLQQDKVEIRAGLNAPEIIVNQAQKAAQEEDNKVGFQADELGEQQKQIRAPVIKGVDEPMRGLPLPPNPAQVPNPIQAHLRGPPEPAHHRQNDDERDIQGDRAVDYGKRQQPIDIL